MDAVKDYLPAIAIIVSFLALLVSVYNSITARRALRISKQQFQNKLSSFSIYLIDNFSITLDTERILLFHITITNKSETKNTFTPTLYLEYIKDDNSSIKIKLSHNPDLLSKIKNQSFSLFNKNLFTNDRESISKWLIFSYAKDLTSKNRIDKYTISLTDVNGVEQSIYSTIMKELPNEI